MPIVKKPQRNTTDIAAAPESVEDDFITGARKPEPAERKPILLRFDPVLLKRIDAAAKHAGLNRAAWIYSTLKRVLDTES
jgi:hypothetical protein